jgi:DNA-directed RNA polymerase specialized sigma24 family protein
MTDVTRILTAIDKGDPNAADQLLAAPDAPSVDLVALDEALCRLERHDADAAALVKLRDFAGLSHQDAADALGISRGAADRLWALGRAWLFRQLSK